MKHATFIGSLTVTLLLLGSYWPPQAETPSDRIILAQGTPQGPYEEPAVMKGKSPEEKMSMRFPQPVKVGDLIGLAVLDDYDLTIGFVRQAVRTPEGKIRLIVTQGGWFGPWFSFGSRRVAVPIEVVVILGRQLAAFDMPRHEFTSAPTWSGNDNPIASDETIKIAIARR